MSINTENFSDSKAAKAHLGFLLLVIITLLSKEEISTMQSIATIFIAIAIPSLVVSLTLLPSENKISEIQLKLSILSMASGHASGLISIGLVLVQFNVVAGIIFFIFTSVAIVVFGGMCVKAYGKNVTEEIFEEMTTENEGNN